MPHEARESRSRGWPTEPGFSTQWTFGLTSTFSQSLRKYEATPSGASGSFAKHQGRWLWPTKQGETGIWLRLSRNCSGVSRYSSSGRRGEPCTTRKPFRLLDTVFKDSKNLIDLAFNCFCVQSVAAWA